MAILTFQNIMDADDITEKTVPIPEWGGDVRVKSISHRQMRSIKERASDGEVSEDFVEQQIILEGLVEPKLNEEQVEHLWDKNTRAITKIMNEILGQSKTKEEASVKEEEKSLPGTAE